MNFKPIHYYILFAFAYILFVFHIPDAGYDKYFLISWSKSMMDSGFSNIYTNPEVNNHPLLLYILKAFTFLFHSSSEINLVSINYIKAFYILFDFLTLGFVVHVLHKNKTSIHFIWLLILNPAFWYNTLIWIQCDTIHTFFIFLSLYFALTNKIHLCSIAMALALATKLQAIIFFPLLLLIVLPQLRLHPKKTIETVIVFIATLFIIMLPFLIKGTFTPSISAIATRSLDFYPKLSVSAYNFWYLLFHSPNNLPDSLSFLGLTYKHWGLMLFGSFLVVLLILLRKSFTIKDEDQKLSYIFLVFTLNAILFFYFNTQMHERYIHPAVLFGGLYAIFSKRLEVYTLVSIGYLLNLESVMQILPYMNKSFYNVYHLFFFNPIFISILILAATIFAFIRVYKLYNQ